jgi:hypothetical protein
MNLQQLITFLRKHHRPLWNRLQTKHYEAPGFQSSEVVAASLGLAIIHAEENFKSYFAASTVFNVMASAKVLDQYDYPMFFVDKKLVSALLRTDPPTELTWANLKMPFPGMIFMLPSAVEVQRKPGPVPFVGVCVLRAGEPHQFPGYVRTVVCEKKEGVCVFWANAPEASDLVIADIVLQTSEHLKLNPESVRQTAEEIREGVGLENEGLEVDSEFTSAMVSLAAKLILVMHARPELVEKAQYIRRTLKNGGAQIWSPNFIGRNYAYSKKSDGTSVPFDKTGKAAEIRFRRGHYRHQPYGPGRQEYKTIWIEPFRITVWVNVASATNSC